MKDKKRTITDILSDYQTLPEYLDRELVDVNQVSLFGDYPLHVAAVRGSVEDIKILVDHGANINAKGEYDYTALHHAAEQGHADAVKALMEKGADPNLTDVNGCTPLEIALLLDKNDQTGEYKKIIEELKRQQT
ncbi:MAG: ankyrin repeat domain-containing protein [Alphaproteobacteria bacterium]|nr:ankyrin repeat domain-containing protein [Alphaproteobacteria bacterium]MBP7759314.1 ankyrin repeat domain-containing protein [Alphaproteobacteria bacterium]MBP7762527.1 ankyrin repeat domain-containing protein [Alphaproteobacteria bacterium]MBP7904274.1 ankyrin repeat domain-containing protein [Alphaproteobacteria bacterium]